MSTLKSMESLLSMLSFVQASQALCPLSYCLQLRDTGSFHHHGTLACHRQCHFCIVRQLAIVQLLMCCSTLASTLYDVLSMLCASVLPSFAVAGVDCNEYVSVAAVTSCGDWLLQCQIVVYACLQIQVHHCT